MTVPSARTAVVPVAGLATRMQPLARSIPKEMLPLGDRPILHHVVDELVLAGVEHVVFVVGANAEPIRRYFGAVPDLDDQLRGTPRDPAEDPVWAAVRQCHISYVEQHRARGVADAVAQARHLVGDRPYVVHMGDSVINGETSLITRMQNAFDEYRADLVVAVGSRLAHPSGAKAVAVPEIRSSRPDQPFAVRQILGQTPPGDRDLPFVIGRYLLRGPMVPWSGPAPRFGRVGGISVLLPDEQSARVIAVPMEIDGCLLGGGTLPEYHASWRAWLAGSEAR